MATIDFPSRPPPPVVQPLEVSRFRDGAWRAVGGETGDCSRSELRLVTFNTWFQGPEARVRNGGLEAELRRADADVILLQETTIPLFEQLQQASWVRESYAVTRAPFRVDSIPSHGLCLLSRLPVRDAALHALPTHMGRSLMVAHTCINGLPVALATVHLESMKPYADVRSRQLARSFEVLGPAATVILGGDFNFCSSSASEQAGIDRRYADLWPLLRPADAGFTQDTEANGMLARAKGTTKQVRFDRLLLRDDPGTWAPQSIELLGTQPIAGARELFPSDHFGLVATLRARQAPVRPAPAND